MSSSIVYRIMLLGLLPLVALFIYYRGQNYEPALIDFSKFQASTNNASLFFPDQIEALIRSGPVRTYTRENLYEYVDGHAEYFISAGFKQLSVGEYSTVTKEEPDVVVDIYDMGKGIQALGILSDESGGNIADIHPGLKGFKTPQGVGFVKGQYYIKISSFNSNIPMEPFIAHLDNSISAGTGPSSDFSGFPDIGQVVGTKYIKEAYRGLDFINNVIEREYRINGKTVHIFILRDSASVIDDKVNAFIRYFKESDITFTEEQEKGKTVYKINDPYEGDWVLISSPDRIMGIFGMYDDTLINSLIK